GLEIPAYLTLPKGVSPKNLPLIAFPHGGPWARDLWGYDTFAQFWANRGYAVLQPNFRGSTGYGKKFIDAGNKQWGDKMQDDITWGGKAQLNRQSPLNSANKIKTPLLVVQGANDPRVNKREADQIVIALRDRGFPVEYIVAPDEGHGFHRPVNNLAMFASAEKFFAN